MAVAFLRAFALLPLCVKKVAGIAGAEKIKLTVKRAIQYKGIIFSNVRMDMSIHNLAENNLIRFINVTQKRDGLFVNFKVNGIKGGVTYSASISVDAAAAEVDMSDPLEKIVETCAYIAVKEIQRTEFQFQGLASIGASN